MSRTGKPMSSFCYANEKPVLLEKYDPKAAEKKCQDFCPEYYKESDDVVIKQIVGSNKRKKITEDKPKKRRLNPSTSKSTSTPSDTNFLDSGLGLGEGANDDEIDWSDCDMEISKNISLVDTSLSAGTSGIKQESTSKGCEPDSTGNQSLSNDNAEDDVDWDDDLDVSEVNKSLISLNDPISRPDRSVLHEISNLSSEDL